MKATYWQNRRKHEQTDRELRAKENMRKWQESFDRAAVVTVLPNCVPPIPVNHYPVSQHLANGAITYANYLK